jgi:hypothetical protein
MTGQQNIETVNQELSAILDNLDVINAQQYAHEISFGEYSRANLILTNENLAADITTQQ